MRSSGSTWIFNVVRKIAELLHPDRPIVGPYVVRGIELPALDDPSRYIIVKTHKTDDLAAARLAEHANASSPGGARSQPTAIFDEGHFL